MADFTRSTKSHGALTPNVLIPMSTSRLPEKIVTPRLVLRQWEVDDIPALDRAITESVEHLRPWMAWVEQEPLTARERADLVEKWSDETRDGGGSPYGVWSGETLVGSAGLHPRGERGSLEIGYWIHTDHIGNGYATEAVLALIEAAFGLPEINRLEIHHDAANLASRRVPEGLGFTIQAEEPREPMTTSESGVRIQWALSRDRWNSR